MNYSQIAARLERYPASPLFARMASEYLDAGRVSDARTLCNAGLLEYPDYATAHLILAECHAAENRYRDAIDSLRRALELNPDSLLFSGLLDEWQELLNIAAESAARETPTPGSEIDAEESTTESTIQTEATRLEAIPAQPELIHPADDWVQVALESAAIPPGTMTPTPEVEESPARSVQIPSEPVAPEKASVHSEKTVVPSERVDAPPVTLASPPQTAARLPDSVTIPPPQSVAFPPVTAQDQSREANWVTQPVTPPRENEGQFSDEGRIVSKTLAEIYVTQGAFDEAILTYRLLKRTRPELVPQIDRRIAELETMAPKR